jgi:hypothetical protein
LCNKYYRLKTNDGKTEFVFDIDDLKNQYKEEDLKLKGMIKKPHVVKLLRKIQDEDEYIKIKGEA